MIFATQDGASFYQFENLAACGAINHRIFTRNSGFSRRPFKSLNVTHGIGDAKENVAANRDIISRSMGAGELVFAQQVHGRNIAVVTGNNEAQFNAASGQSFTADAMVTDIAEKNLVIQVADCQAVLMYEPTRHVVANVHCGWRGSIQNIIGRTVDLLKHHFGCNPGNILAGIGPSLGPCCAEFVNYKIEIPMAFRHYKDSKDHFDFWSISCDQLKAAGVPEKNIESSQICTHCRTDEFFSYRAEKTTGRFAAVIGLTKASGGSIAVRS
ncbi:MAG: peptidoglycan editing factor PgeF [Desulfobacterales bacterium]|nr:peptidoglycan editing factor PgeF [Desulfobacterales bacterium]